MPGPNAEGERRFLLTLWMAFAVCVGVYFLLLQLQPPPPQQDNPTIITVLFVIAVGLVAASFAVKGRLRAQAGSQDNAALRRTAFIVPIAMCDAAAIFGLATRIGFGFSQYYWFLALGLAGILLHYPKREN